MYFRYSLNSVAQASRKTNLISRNGPGIKSLPLLFREHTNLTAVQQGKAKANELTWIGLWANLGLFGIKGAVGYLSGSSSLIADAVHSASDIGADAIALMALHLSRKPPSSRHPYGYGHFESLGTLGVSGFLLAAGFGTAYHSFNQFLPFIMNSGTTDIDIPGIEYVPAAIGCAAFAVIVKELLFHVTINKGKSISSPVLIATAWHHRTDSLSSIVAIIGIGGYQLGYPLLDPLAGIVVAGMVLRPGLETGWAAIEDLTDRQRESDEVIDKVVEIGKTLAESTKGEVLDIHNIRCRRLGGYNLLDIHISVDPKLSVTAAYQAANRVKQHILENVKEVTDVFTHIQAHPSRSSNIRKHSSYFYTEGNVLEPSDLNMYRRQYVIPSELDRLQTKPKYEIEQDIENAVRTAAQPEIESISHCSIHYLVSGVDEISGTRSLVQTAEVNLVMDQNITLKRAEEVARIAREYILNIPYIHAVDMHVETFPDEIDPNIARKL